MGLAEIRQEREILQSIYPEEIEVLDDLKFRMSITLDDNVVNYGKGTDEVSDIYALDVTISLTEAYPDEAPVVEINPVSSAFESAYLSADEDIESLLDTVNRIAQENLKDQMIFTLITTLKEHVENLITDRQLAEAARRKLELMHAEEAENEKFSGQPVTKASFMEWREKFRSEMERIKKQKMEEALLLEAKSRKNVSKDDTKLTGRQLWERGLAVRGEE